MSAEKAKPSRSHAHLVSILDTLEVTLDVMLNTEDKTPPPVLSSCCCCCCCCMTIGGVLPPPLEKLPAPMPGPPNTPWAPPELSLPKLSIHERGLDNRFSTCTKQRSQTSSTREHTIKYNKYILLLISLATST